MVENAAPQLRSWVRQGIDVTKVMQAALDAEAAAAAAKTAATAARAAADQALAALNEGGGGGGGSSGLVYPENIQGSTIIGRNLLTAAGANYIIQQQAARDIIGSPKLGTASTDAAPGTLTAAVAALTTRVATLEQGGTGGGTGGTGGKDNINVDTDGRPYWID